MQKKIFLAGNSQGNDVFASQISSLVKAFSAHEPTISFEFRELNQDPAPKDEMEIIVGPPTTKLGRYSILYTRWESHEVPPKTLTNLNRAFHIVVPTEWHKTILAAAGVTKEISVIPFGVNLTNHSPSATNRFSVGFVGDMEHADVAWRCFKMAFPLFNGAVFSIVVTDGALKTKDSRVFHFDFANEEFFKQNTILIEMSCNEYWAMQSMAVGKPVIGPNAGPLSEIGPQFGLPCMESKGKNCLSFVPHHVSTQLKQVFHLDRLPKPESVQKKVEMFKWSNCVSKLIELIGSLSQVKILGGSTKTDRTCIVQLGRYGDILNILPVAKHIYDRDGKRPVFMVSKAYASILNAISYVEPHVYNGDYARLSEAIEIAKAHYSNVVVSQVYGIGIAITPQQPSFNTESWRCSGYLAYWSRLPLILDMREKAREETLVKSMKWANDRPNVLLCFSGFSSPFEFAEEVLEDLRFRFDHLINFILLDKVKAVEVFDLLGLMDHADAMITIDTAALHLARASKINYIALVASGPWIWHGSTPTKNCWLTLRYNEAVIRREEIHSTLRGITKLGRSQFRHVWVEYPSNHPDESRRRRLAAKTWKQVYSLNPLVEPMPIIHDQLPRLFDDGKRKLPYIKDVIEFAFSFCMDSDVIILTNIDICFSESVAGSIEKMMEGRECAYCYRRDFKKLDGVLPPNEIGKGDDYCGTDVFIFRAKWWRDNVASFPDMLMGAEAWDPVMRTIMHETDQNTGIFKDLFYHERHPSVWEQAENRYALTSQIYNLNLAKGFFNVRKIDTAQFGII